MPALTPSRIRTGAEFDDLGHSTFAPSKRASVGVFSLSAQVRLAGGNCVLDLEDTRFSKREGR